MPKDPESTPGCGDEAQCRQRRSYNLGRRQEGVDESRARILAAARDIVMSDEALKGFTMDALARRAGVARMTVYHRFGSKLAVLEALFDELGARGGMTRLGQVFAEPEPRAALARYIALFCGFWASDRLVIRRLRALSKLDHDFGEGIRQRDGWRRGAVQTLAARMSERHGLAPGVSAGAAADILFALTGFETFDTLAGETGSPEEVSDLVLRLALAAFGQDDTDAR